MAVDDTKNGMAEALGEALANQLEEQQKYDAEFRAHTESTREQAKQVQDALFDSLHKKRSGPEYPKEVIEIANALMAQPRLIPPMQAFLKTLATKINDAVNQAVNEALGHSQESETN